MKKIKMSASGLSLKKVTIVALEERRNVFGGATNDTYFCNTRDCPLPPNPFTTSTIHAISNGGVNVLSVCQCPGG